MNLLIRVIFLCVLFHSCQKSKGFIELDQERTNQFNNNVDLAISGPFYYDSISRRFDLPLPDSNLNFKDAFVLNVKNFDEEIGVFIDATPDGLVFADSSTLYTYRGHGATEKGYLTMVTKPHKSRKFYKTETGPESEKDFYFFNSFDSDTDSIGFYFTLFSERKYRTILYKNRAYVVQDGVLSTKIKH